MGILLYKQRIDNYFELHKKGGEVNSNAGRDKLHYPNKQCIRTMHELKVNQGCNKDKTYQMHYLGQLLSLQKNSWGR